MVDRHGVAAVAICHPDRKRLLSPIDFNFDVSNLVNSVPARDRQFSAAEKRMERVTHGYDARVAGIIARRFFGGRGTSYCAMVAEFYRLHRPARYLH